MSDGKLVKIKAGVSGSGASGELEIDKGLVPLISRIFPTTAAKKRATAIVSSQVLHKIQAGIPLDEADLAYTEALFAPAEAKWVRQRAIAERVNELLVEGNVAKRLPQPQHEPADTTDSPDDVDWFARAEEDIGVVTDEVLRELYSRVIAAKTLSKAACSKRTLGVLRDLDHYGATLFAKALLIECDESIVRDENLMALAGLSYGDVLELGAAGLVDPASTLTRTLSGGDPIYLACRHRVLRVTNTSGASFPAFPLTRAGRELSRIAEVEPDEHQFRSLVGFLTARLAKNPQAQVLSAVLPHIGWTGPERELDWRAEVMPQESNSRG